jgi:hypothetical protein
MNRLFLISLFFVSLSTHAQTDRGPINVLSGGVVDGVVLKEDVPLRSKVEYEHVREADYVWSKRVFSRIDAREKLNHGLFLPYDFFPGESWQPPRSESEINKKDWIKHQDRFSLWTIIMKHTMLGDLTIYEVADKDFSVMEDGYSFKYPLEKISKDSYFTDPIYSKKINRKFSFGGPGEPWEIQGEDENATKSTLMKESKDESFEDWKTRLTTKGKAPDFDPAVFGPLERIDVSSIKPQYDAAVEGTALKSPDVVQFISSQSITAYNIKEDWFFDKERSILDRRIIAIAPVARMAQTKSDDPNEISNDGIDRFKSFISVTRNGDLEWCKEGKFESFDFSEQLVEKELFWLYFPELRDVIVNYFVYNEQSDSQWMSFDDLFWKRKFSSTIYKVSDKFDREIEDYKYGVDALYEAEKIKEDIRKWEIDVWNY